MQEIFMLEREDWLKLISGLVSSTEERRLEWEQRDHKFGEDKIHRINDSAFDRWRPLVYFATRPSGSYELSSVDGYGKAPYELTVWYQRGSKLVPLDHLVSTTDITNMENRQLNVQLGNLFRTVQNTTDGTADIVSRLLGDLD